MNILGLSSAFPYPNGVIPASIGGTGDKRNIGKMLARKANYINTPIWPSVFAYPPTIAASSSGTIGTGPLVGWNGQQRMMAVAASWATAGTNIIPVSTTYAPLVRVGQRITHIMNPANNYIPAGTTVTAVDTGTGYVTMSQNLTATMPGNDYVGFGENVINFLGAYAQPIFTSSFPYTKNSINASWTATPFAVEFDYYGTGFNVIFHDTNGQPRFWLWVDGQPVTSAYSLPGSYTPSTGNRAFFNVTFDNVGDNTARWRRIRLYLINAKFGGIKIGVNDAVAATRLSYPKIAWLGDSWTEGVTGTGFGTDLLNTTPQLVNQLLGLGPPIVAGQGSTGYMSNGGANKATFGDSTRIDPLVAANPDALVIWGTINDDAYTDTQVQNAAFALYSSLQRQLPQTKLLVVGVQSRGGKGTAQNRANNLGIKAACAAANVPFLSPLEEGWVEGSGYYGHTTGMGNADVFLSDDGGGASAHCQQAGWEYYARRIAAWIADQV